MTEPAQPEATYTIEWAPLALAEGVDEAALLTASQVLQRDFFSRQLGFLHRELLKRSANQWVDIIHWESRDAVEQAMRNAQARPVCHSYFTLMVPSSQNDLTGASACSSRPSTTPSAAPVLTPPCCALVCSEVAMR